MNQDSIITDKQNDEEMDELLDYKNEELDKFLSAFKYALENIDYPSEKIKEYLRYQYNCHVGYCRVMKSDYKSSSYPSHDFYRIIGDIDGSDSCIDVDLMRQDDNKKDSFHCLVHQVCVYEDCYSGHLLFPLKDGRYWVLSFTC